MDDRYEQTADVVTLTAAAETRAVTMQDIADHCGVSLITVSRALRDDARVKPDTAERIREAATKLGYDPACHHAARRLALRKHGIHVINHIFALFMQGDFARANYFVSLFRGVLEKATSQGFALLTSDPLMPDPLPIYSRGDVDGFLILGWVMEANRSLLTRFVRSAQGRPCPVVAMLTPVEGCSNVLTDDHAGAYAATTHLLELGHRQILHFWPVIPAMEPIYLNAERRTGCRQAFLDRGIDPETCLHGVRMNYNLPMDQRMHEVLERVLTASPDITAVLLPNDGYASQAREALRTLGRRIPDDFSLIGFDDAEVLPDAVGQNVLTTVRVPMEEVGRTAAEMLAKQVTRQQTELETVTLPTALVVRGTTAARR